MIVAAIGREVPVSFTAPRMPRRTNSAYERRDYDKRHQRGSQKEKIIDGRGGGRAGCGLGGWVREGCEGKEKHKAKEEDLSVMVPEVLKLIGGWPFLA